MAAFKASPFWRQKFDLAWATVVAVGAVLISGCTLSVRVGGQTKKIEDTTTIPIIQSFLVTNGSYTNSTTFNLSLTHRGFYTEYCLMENNTDVLQCVWNTGSIPSSFVVSTTEETKVLSLWLKNSFGISAIGNSNSVVLDTTDPARLTNLTLSSPASTPALDTTPTLSLDSIEANASVQIYSDSGCSTLVGTLSDAGAGGTITASTNALSANAYTFYATQTDRAGNASPCSLSSVAYDLKASAASVSITSHTTPHNYGSVDINTTSTVTFTVRNSGGSDITNMVFSGLSGVFVKTGAGTCGSTLAAGATCTVALALTPVAITTYTQTLNIAYDDETGASGSYNFVVTGTGASNPTLSYLGATGTTGTVGIAMSISPTTLLAGPSATIASCAIKTGTPALPTGLSVDSSTCAISGTPTVSAAATTYTVRLTNSFAQVSDAVVSLTVTAIPTLASVTISNSSPTNSTTYNLTYGAITGAYSHYCILENSTTVGSCSWTAGTVPSTYTVSASENSKVLSVWLRNAQLGVSTRVDSNAVILDTTAPARPTGLALSSPATSPALDTTPTISVGNIENNATVWLYKDNICSAGNLVATLSDSGALSTVDLTTSALTAGAYTFYARQRDQAGNGSLCSLSSIGYQLNASAASVSITSHTSPYDFGSVAVGATVTETFTVTNAGGSDVSTLSFTGLSGVYTVTGGGTCGGTLSKNASCTLEVSYTPVAAVTSSQTLSINSTDELGNSATSTMAISGTGTSGIVLSYAGATGRTGTVGVAMSVTPTSLVPSAGASVATCAIKGGTSALPMGLSVNNTTCEISGTPSVSATSANYTITMTDTFAASVDATVSLTVTALPVLDSVTITNSNPTNSTTYSLTYGTITNSYSDYCIRENSTDVSGCVWVTGALPADTTVTATENAKVLSVWLRNSLGGVSVRVDSNSVTLDTTAPNAPTALTLGGAAGNIAPTASPDTSDSPTIGVSGVISGHTVTLYDDPACAANVVGSAVASGMTVDISLSGVAGGAHTYTATSQDPAGNISACSTASVAYSRLYGDLSFSADVFPDTVTGVPVDVTYTVTNSGTGVATFESSNSMTMSDGSLFTVTGGTCADGLVLASAATCTVTIKFSATKGEGTFTDNLNFAYNDGISVQNKQLSLSVNSTDTGLLTIGSISFTNTLVGSFTFASVNVTNVGLFDVQIIDPKVDNLATGTNFFVKDTTCREGVILKSGEVCTVDIQFMPTTTGTLSDTVTVNYSSGKNNVSVSKNFSGVGIPNTGVLSMDAISFSSTAVGGVSDVRVTVTNTGGGDATMTGTDPGYFTTGTHYLVKGSACGTGVKLTPGQKCTIDLQFKPLAKGTLTDTFNVSYDDSFTGQIATQNVSAVATGKPDLAWIRQLGTSYTRTLNTTADNSGDDSCLSVTSDSFGNTYCAGYTAGSLGYPNAGETDAIVVKFDSSNTIEWIYQTGTALTDRCNSVTTDSAGNVYCAGHTTGSLGETNGGGTDAFVMKLNSSGILQWVTQLGATTKVTGGSNAGNDVCNSITLDGSNNVYCAGNTSGSMGETNGGGSDVFVLKLNSSGIIQWVRQLGNISKSSGGSNSNEDAAYGIAIDSSLGGGIYVGGVTQGSMGEVNGGGNNPDVFILRLFDSGALHFVRQFGGITTLGGNNSGNDYCYSLVVDSIGQRVYCGGYTTGSMMEAAGGGNDAIIVSMDLDGGGPTGTQLGAVTKLPGRSNSNADYCYGIYVKPGDGVYCAGLTYSSMAEATGGNGDAFIWKAPAAGGISWIRQLGASFALSTGGDASMTDGCSSISMDSSGNIVCGGYSYGSLLGNHKTANYDLLIAKVRASDGVYLAGTQLHDDLHPISGRSFIASTGSDFCYDTVSDSSGNIYCAGFTAGPLGEGNGGSGDAFIMKTNSSGVVQWVTQLGSTTKASGGSNAGNDNCYGIALDSNNNVYCAGATTGAMAEANAGGRDAFILKLNSAGTLQWVKQLGNVTKLGAGYNTGDDICYDIAVSGTGVYCAGGTSGNIGEQVDAGDNAFVWKVNTSGTFQWIRQLGLVSAQKAYKTWCNSIAADSNGNVYCGGTTAGSPTLTSGQAGTDEEAGGGDAFVLKLNSSGATQWLRQLGTVTKAPGGSNSGEDQCLGVAVDSSNNIYCAGFTRGSMGEANAGGGDAFVMKLEPTSGNLLWLKQLGQITKDASGSNSGWDVCNSVSTDSSNNVYCAGHTTSNMGETNGGSSDAFILKMNSSGTLQWVTQLGQTTKAPGGSNSSSDLCYGMNVDSSDNLICGGYTESNMGDTSASSKDAFILKFTP